MISINYLVFRDIINLLAFFGAGAMVCFLVRCALHISILYYNRKQQTLLNVHCQPKHDELPEACADQACQAPRRLSKKT